MKHSQFRIRNGFNSNYKSRVKLSQKVESEVGDHQQYLPSSSSVPYDETTNFNNNDAFLKLFANIVGSLQQLTKSPLLRRNDLQVRDRSYLLEIPNGRSFLKNKQILKKWIEKMVSDIVSIAFNYFSNDQFTYEQAKIFCSQNILSNIAALVKKYKLTSAQLKEVDDFIRDDVLELLSKKYPMTESIVVNRALEAIAKAPDLSQKLENDFFSIANISFEEKDNQGFSRQIKMTINSIINHINQQNNLVKQASNFEVFQKLMAKVFQLVQESDWMSANEAERSDAIQSYLYNLQYKEPTISSQRAKESVFFVENDSSKREYREKVKQYTSYLIGRKVSENTPSFTEEEMTSSRIEIKSTAILRILTKWCEELWQKFIPKNYYMNKNEDFRLLNGQVKSVSLQMRSNLDKLMQAQKAKIKAFMSKVTNDNYEAQINLLNQLLENSQDQFWEKNLQKISQKFSVLIGKSLEKWVVKYLSRLMQGLSNVSNQFYLKYLSDQWPCPPNLITFKIGDLMRCKCSSGEREIRYIFQIIKWLSDHHPEILSITRIKNRLSLGTNDILMNVKFCGSIICEIQLAVNSKKSKFIKCSNVMSHYLYQIQRSLFGPINQLGSIWRSLDLRASYFDKNAGGGKSAGSHRCESQKKAFQFQGFDAPFICSQCNNTYSQNTMRIKHVKCSQCSYWKCALCQIKEIPSEKLAETFIPDPELRKKCLKKILFGQQTKQLPNFGISINLQADHKSQVLVYKKIELRGINYIFAKQSGKVKLLLKITHDGAEMQYLRQHLVFQIDRQNGTNLIELTEEQVSQEYFLPLHISDCYKNRKNAITLEKEPIDNNNCISIFNGSQQSRGAITSLSLSETRLEKISPLEELFPNLSHLSLHQNQSLLNFDGLPLFIQLKQLTLRNSTSLLQMPESLFKLPLLVKLDLKNCIFAALPSSIGQLKNLRYLDLSHSEQIVWKQYIRQLPKQLYSLTELEELNLDHQLIKQLDENICNLKKLKYLNIRHNSITELPASIIELQQLQFFDFRENPLNVLPSSLSKFSNLKQLRLENIGPEPINFFNERIFRSYFKSLPEDLQQVKHLKIIDIHSQYLKELPSLEKCSQLQEINLFRCSLTKPPKLKNCQSLLRMNLKQQMFPPETEGTNCFTDDLFNQTPNLTYFCGSYNSMKFVPSSVKFLTKLVELDLSRNEIEYLCQEIGECISLVRLNLWYNKIQKIPNSFRHLQKLQFLSLAENELSELNESITECVGLHKLIVHSNRITAVPARLGNLINLEMLDFQDNFVGLLPQSLENLKKLQPQMLKFDRNPVFLVQCPSVVQKFGSQQTKNFADNYSNGTYFVYLNKTSMQRISSEIKKAKKLTKISVNNQLLQELPSEIQSLTLLESVQFYNNKLTEFPICLTGCSSLKSIILEKNQIQKVPAEIGKLVNLEVANLSCNQISLIDQQINSCQNLNNLNLSYNKLTFIPSIIFSTLNNLVVAAFTSNQLSHFPEGLLNSSKLENLDLSYNQIKNLPKGLKNLTQLKVINLQNNLLTEFPEQLLDCYNLAELALNYNMIVSISDSLFKLQNLSQLSMNHNCITAIPSSIAKAKSLNKLNLPNNKIQVVIKDLQNLTSMQVINLYNNPLKKVQCRSWIMKTGTSETKKKVSLIQD